MVNDNNETVGVFQQVKNELTAFERKKARKRYIALSFLLFLSIAVLGTAYATKEAKVEPRQWATLSQEEKDALRIEAFVLFPEILSFKTRNKYSRVNKWIVKEKGVVHSNIRDAFRIEDHITEAGQEIELPKIYATFINDLPQIKQYIAEHGIDHSFYKIKLDHFAKHPDDLRVEDIIKERFVSSAPP